MNKTIEALDSLLSAYIYAMKGFIMWDIEVFQNHAWMSYTVIPSLVFSLYLLFKYAFLFGIILTPLSVIIKTPFRLVIEMVNEYKKSVEEKKKK